jgi:hypothetical protein
MNPQQAGVSEPDQSGSKSSRNIFIEIILTVLLIAALVFGGWAFSKMQDYKNNSDKKAAAAVAAAKKTQAAQLQAQFDQQSKSPNKTFTGSPTYGSITFNYPKTWSAYVDTSSSSEPINGYFYPDTVPGTQSKTAYALRVELVSSDYSQIMQQFSSQITQGTVTAKAYVPPKLQGAANVAAGSYLSGQINSQDQTQNGNMLVMKVRDKTLEIYSESTTFAADFNNTVLASLSFAP